MENKYIEVVLENCEVYEFKAEDVKVMFHDVNIHYWGGRKHLCPKHCCLSIESSAKAKPQEEWQRDWQERFEARDITQIWIDGEGYHVDWGDDEWTNPYQTNTQEPDRFTYIISKTHKTMTDFLI